MKYLLIAISLMFLTSCGDDFECLRSICEDEVIVTPPPTIEGQWVYESGDCSQMLTIEDGKYNSLISCYYGYNTINTQFVYGEYKDVNGQLTITTQGSTCGWEPDYEKNYVIDGKLLFMSDRSSTKVYKRYVNRYNSGPSNFTLIYGCYTEDGFVENPVKDYIAN